MGGRFFTLSGRGFRGGIQAGSRVGLNASVSTLSCDCAMGTGFGCWSADAREEREAVNAGCCSKCSAGALTSVSVNLLGLGVVRSSGE